MAEIAIVGAGAVGVACAGSVLRQGLASRLVFYDRHGDRALGEALDFQHAAPLLPDCAIEGRPLAEATSADIAIIAAGAPPEAGADRLSVLDRNLEVAAEIAASLTDALPRVAIVISNPVDVVTEFFTRAWASHGVNVFGTGTALDSWRLRELLADRLGIHPGSVHAWVIGEHGNSAVFPFSLPGGAVSAAPVRGGSWPAVRPGRDRRGGPAGRPAGARAERLHEQRDRTHRRPAGRPCRARARRDRPSERPRGAAAVREPPRTDRPGRSRAGDHARA